MHMQIKPITPEFMARLEELSQSSYRPKAILDIEEEIKGETRAAELHHSVTGLVDYGRIQAIVQLKLQRDALYGDWIEGRIE